MTKFGKILVYLLVFTTLANASFADRGVGRKKKAPVSLNVNLNGGFKNNLSFNLNNGLKYKGSISGNSSSYGNLSSNFKSTILTYQKGNVVYIVPVKQKVILKAADAKPGYAGMKLILKVP